MTRKITKIFVKYKELSSNVYTSRVFLAYTTSILIISSALGELTMPVIVGQVGSHIYKIKVGLIEVEKKELNKELRILLQVK